jgi:hypothetical protein
MTAILSDLTLLLASVALFALALAYTAACQRLHPKHVSTKESA